MMRHSSFFSQIEGIEAHRRGQSAAQMMAASLVEEQKQQDVWRILLCEIVQHIAFYLQPGNANVNESQETQTFERLGNDLSKLSQKAHGAERILIRYRGRSSESTISERLDYEILFGNMLVDLDLLPAMIKRHGQVSIPPDGPIVGSLRGFFGQGYQQFESQDTRAGLEISKSTADVSEDCYTAVQCERWPA